LKERVRSVEASLSYEVPEPMRSDLYLSVVADMNRTPCPASSVRIKRSRVRNQSFRPVFLISIEERHIPNGVSTWDTTTYNATIEPTCLLVLLSTAGESSHRTTDTQQRGNSFPVTNLNPACGQNLLSLNVQPNVQLPNSTPLCRIPTFIHILLGIQLLDIFDSRSISTRRFLTI
jgi:hypothetical protein